MTQASQATDDLYASLLDGMHAMAQPLTLLQSRVHLAQWQRADMPGQEGARGFAGRAADGDTHLLPAAGGSGLVALGGARSDVTDLADAELCLAADIDELCRLFGLMQELLQVRSVPARRDAVAYATLNAALGQTAEAVFASSGVEIDLDFEAAAPEQPHLWLELDLARTRRAFSSLLLVARELATPTSIVTCTLAPAFANPIADVSPSALQIECRIAASSCQLAGQARLSGHLRLHLALARHCLVSQQGRLNVSLAPFLLMVVLPLWIGSEPHIHPS